MSKIKGTMEVNVSGNFLNGLIEEQAKRVKHLKFDFSKGETINWDNEVYKSLTTRIGFYTVIDKDDEIIYVGLANGEDGLKGRHCQHEKNDIFELFDVEKLTVYYADELDLDDPGQIALLERYLIYTLEPLLNDDIKRTKSTLEFINNKMIEKMNEILNDVVFGEIDDMRGYVEDIDNYNEKLEILINEKDNEKKHYLDALDNETKTNTELSELKSKYKEKLKQLKNYNDNTIPEINKIYKIFSFMKTYAK